MTAQYRSILDELLKIGFDKAGRFCLKDGELDCELDKYCAEQDVLYCFTVDGLPVYVGKTVQPLKRRIYGYLKPGPTQKTNVRNKKEIIKALLNGKNIEIYVFSGGKRQKYGNFDLSLAAGLEDSIIKYLRSELKHKNIVPWNKL